MANTFELIASSTVGAGGAANIDFTSIPSTYTDLMLKCSLRTNHSGSDYGYIDVAFNGSTANANWLRILGYSTAASSGSGVQFRAPQDTDTATASTFANMDIYIPNYAGSTYKSVSVDSVTENNSGAAEAAFCTVMAGLWSQTAAINQITFSPWSSFGTLFKQYSSIYLYGVKNA